jgi:hypothetical protein
LRTEDNKDNEKFSFNHRSLVSSFPSVKRVNHQRKHAPKRNHRSERLTSSFLIETHSLLTLARRYPRGLTFYVAHPSRSILNSVKERGSHGALRSQLSCACLLASGTANLRAELQKPVPA